VRAWTADPSRRLLGGIAPGRSRLFHRLACAFRLTRKAPGSGSTGRTKEGRSPFESTCRSAPSQLKRLPVLHLRPINQLVSLGSYLVNPVGVLVRAAWFNLAVVFLFYT
jgi:hypothetical protein